MLNCAVDGRRFISPAFLLRKNRREAGREVPAENKCEKRTTEFKMPSPRYSVLLQRGLCVFSLTSYLSISQPNVAARALLISDKGYLFMSMASTFTPNSVRTSFFCRRLLPIKSSYIR